jgi:hypothetical protein
MFAGRASIPFLPGGKPMKKLFWIPAMALLATAITGAAPVRALTTSHIPTDADMLGLLSDTLFVAEGRIGDRGGAATFEVDLGGDTGSPATTAQYNWQTTVPVSWTLTYNHVTNLITFTLDTVVLQYTTPLSGFSDVFVRTRAVNASSDIVVDNLVLDGVGVGDTSNANGNIDGLDILWISGGTLTDGFTLTGRTTMTWTGSAPTQSRLAFQLKVGTVAPVATEPATWGRVKALYRD